MLLEKVPYAHKGCIYLINNTVKQFKIAVFYFNIFKKLIYSSEGKAEFPPSEIILICWFGAQKHFLYVVINVENSCAA